MKKLLALTLLAGCGFQPANEDPITEPETRIVEVIKEVTVEVETPVLPSGVWTQTRPVKDETTNIALQLDDTSVFCTVLGYGVESFLKVSIPQLDALAHFDHRVEGTNLPCAAVGECSAQMNADNILQGSPGVEPVDLRVVLVEKFTLDGDAKTCTRQLIEDVSTEVRGVPLKHHVEGEVLSAPLTDCTGR